MVHLSYAEVFWGIRPSFRRRVYSFKHMLVYDKLSELRKRYPQSEELGSVLREAANRTGFRWSERTGRLIRPSLSFLVFLRARRARSGIPRKTGLLKVRPIFEPKTLRKMPASCHISTFYEKKQFFSFICLLSSNKEGLRTA